jgi:hypothetical protein
MKKSVKDLVSIAEAIELLERDGIIVTEDQAEQILEFLGSIAEIVVEQYLESENINLGPPKRDC